MTSRPLETLVYVDDEDDIREVAMLALEDVGGLQVQSFPGGRQLLAALPESPPDLLLLDVMMPGMDGPMLLAELRRYPAWKNIPAVFMTAKVQTSEIDALIAAGAIGVVAKPFDPMTLADTVRQLQRTYAGTA